MNRDQNNNITVFPIEATKPKFNRNSQGLSSAVAIKISPEQVVDSVFDVKKPNRDVINVDQMGMDQIIDHAIKTLIDTGLVFDRGASLLVAIDRNNTIHQLNARTVRFALSKLVDYRKAGKNGERVSALVPTYVGETICAMTRWEGMPIVCAVSDHPAVITSGRMILPGYDKETMVYCRYNPEKYSVPENPTLEDAIVALAHLQRLLQTFDFETAGDEAAALAGILTAVTRPVLRTALQTLIDAVESGSGKGYLGTLMSYFCENEEPFARQMQADDGEMHKAIMAVLRAAKSVCFFDELGMSQINLPALRSFGSAPCYSGRILGGLDDAGYINRTFTLATGNNVTPDADMARRMMLLRLNPKCENPSARTFIYKGGGVDDNGKPIETAQRELKLKREFFVSQVLIIQKAFLKARERGETPASPTWKAGGYEDWETLCREPVMWLTGADPCERMRNTMRNSPSKNALKSMMAAWQLAFGDRPTKANEALKNEGFLEVCEEHIKRKPGSHVNTINLAIWLTKHKGQITDNGCFDEVGEDAAAKVKYWGIVKN